ncbi:MAG: hypothetical protein J6Y20_12515 [Lachnospiraceae bacterium]|nr:hypothetical protein [Lachnospiraceae bacterium]MBR4813769.1 hypothetical protein [Lachnospiraceae bacterium]MBR7020423.1 hypothetical protein [Lachnospiraceae bacterium]
MIQASLLPLLSLKWLWITLAIIAVVVIILFIVLSIVGKRLQKKNDAAMAEMKASARPASMLVIDKKRMPLKDAGFPQVVLDSTPKYARRAKVPVVKAKIGPQILSLMCDEKIFDLIPVKKECKAMISGIYIMQVHGVRGALQKDETPKKRGLLARLRGK